MPLFRCVVLSLSVLAVSCAPKLMKLPSGPRQPASDTRTALESATTTCRAIKAFSAEIGAAGSVAGQRFRARLLAGLAAPASVRLEAVAPFGPPIFIFVAHGDDATLLLPRDDRVLEHGRPEPVLQAIAGVPLDAADLRSALTGCATATDAGSAIGADWRVTTAGRTEVYLHRTGSSGQWQVVAAVRRDWRAEYRDYADGLPRSVRLVDVNGKRFDLRLTLSQVEIDPALGPEAFRIDVPRSAVPITLEELKNARPGVRKD